MDQNERSQPVEIDDPIVLDVINDPLRYRIWRQLASPRSAKELAPVLGLPAARLYYHLNLLERSGWIRVAEERKAGTRTERYWVAAFDSYRISERLMSSGEARHTGAVIGALDDMVGEFQATIAEADTPGAQHILNRFHHLPIDRANEFAAKVRDLVDEYMGPPVLGSAPRESSDGQLHGALFLLFPFEELPGSQVR